MGNAGRKAHADKAETPNRLAGLVGSSALAGAFLVYYCVTFVPDAEWTRVPICLGLLLTWVGSLLVENLENPERLRRIGLVTMQGTMPTIFVVLWLHRMLWSRRP